MATDPHHGTARVGIHVDRGETWTGKRWVATTTASVGSINVTERSRAAACAGLASAIQTLAERFSSPRFITAGNAVAVVYLALTGDGPAFAHTILVDGSVGGASVGAATNWDDAETEARRALAMRITDWLDDESLEAGLKIVRNDPDRYDLRRYAAWQRAYAHGEKNGESDPHRYAGEHESDFHAEVGLEPMVVPLPRSLVTSDR